MLEHKSSNEYNEVSVCVSPICGVVQGNYNLLKIKLKVKNWYMEFQGLCSDSKRQKLSAFCINSE